MTASARRRLWHPVVMRSRPAVLVVAALVALAPAAHAGTKVRLRGGGWGHGLGMSQYGAYGRALNGRSATDIVGHYYSGTRVRKRAMPNKVRVGLLQARKSIAAESWAFDPGGGTITWRVEGRDTRIARGGPDDRFKVVRTASGRMKLLKNGDRIERSGARSFGGNERDLVAAYERHGSAVEVIPKSTSYAYGTLRFGTYASSSCGSSQCLRLVVSLPMQKYLYGLAEMPSSWPRAALRAQAIAGRTYAFEKIRRLGQRREPCGCAVYDSVLDQVYAGDSKRIGSGEYWDKWRSAVDASARKVVVDGGDPIQALYMSSSGGHTEDNEAVWGGTPLPYLRGVRDRADGVDANPNHEWTVKRGWGAVSKDLDAAYGTGDLERFKLVKPFGVSGRVTVVTSDGGGVKIVGSDKTVRTSGWSIRSVLGLKDTLFRVKVIYDTATAFEAAHADLAGAPGRPVSVAYAVPRRSGAPLGRAQDFERGRLTLVSATGEVVWQHGDVLDAYDAHGRERGRLGMPAGPVRTAQGVSWARYARGLLVRGDAGGHSVTGGFAARYRAAGGPAGPLGAPLGGRIRTARGLVQGFEGGFITDYGAGPAVSMRS